MLKRATPPADAAVFSGLPIRTITSGSGSMRLAVHIHGDLSDATIPVLCLPGYLRNMADFTVLPTALNRLPGQSLCFILIDLPGRGRSSRSPKNTAYSTLRDADCALDVLRALDVARAIILGEGHGGQVAMVMAASQPLAIAGAVLADAGPVTDSRGLVRTRTNFRHLVGLRGPQVVTEALRRIFATDYPDQTPARLDALADRLYVPGPRGRVQPLFDPKLIEQLERFEVDDVFEPQWPLFDALAHVPLMLVRTALTDQVRRATFDEMVRRRPDAALLTISGQGSPALLDGAAELEALSAFLRDICQPRPADTAVESEAV